MQLVCAELDRKEASDAPDLPAMEAERDALKQKLKAWAGIASQTGFEFACAGDART